MKKSKLFLFALCAAIAFSGAYTTVAQGGAVERAEAVNMINSVEDKGMLVKESVFDDDALYVRPAMPSGSVAETVCAVSYDYSSIDWVYAAYGEKVSALEYGFTMRRGGDQAMYICTTGANHGQGIQYWTPAKNIQGAEGAMTFVDFRGLNDGKTPGLGLTLRTSPNGDKGSEPDLDDHVIVNGVTCYYYDYSGEWKETTVKNGYASLPDGFVGYVYFPISAFEGLSTTEKVCLQFVRVHYDIHDAYECASTILTDDLAFVRSGAAHEHSYSLIKNVPATCKREGYDLYMCSTCGQTKCENVTEKTAHATGASFALGKGSGAICSYCGELVRSEKPSDNLVRTVKATFVYGEPLNETVELEFPFNYTLKKSDVPWKYVATVENGYGITDYYQLFAFHTDETYQYPSNPVGCTLDENKEFYASYNLCSYDQEHYGHMFRQVAAHGGPYCADKFQGKAVFIGNSNYMLWWGMEGWYEQRGITVLNNSVAGSTSYDLINFVEELILIYHPKVVVFGISSNDYAYHQMKDRTIIDNACEFMNRILAVSPDTKFIITSANPLPGRPEYFEAVSRVNVKVKALCDELDYATYIDTEAKVMEYCMRYPDGWNFWTHMNEPELSVILGDFVIDTLRTLLAQ